MSTLDWLINELKFIKVPEKHNEKLWSTIEKAREMDKQRIITAFDMGVSSVLKNFDKAYSEIDGEDYHEMFKVMNDIASEKTTKPKDFKF